MTLVYRCWAAELNDGQQEEREFFRLLESLAGSYNSQITSHVGYVLTFTLFVGTSAMVFLLQVLFVPNLGPLSKFGALVLVAILVWVYLFVKRSPVCFSYLYGRAQFYVALSGIVWQHMEFLGGEGRPEQLTTRRLRDRAVRFTSISHGVTTIFEARLFVSRCLRKGLCYKDERIRRALHYFDITNDEQEAVLPLNERENYYDRPFLRFWNIADIIYLAYRAKIENYCRLEMGLGKGTLLKDPVGTLLELERVPY